MEAMRVYHQLNEDGEVHLKGLPYKKGEEVELILIPAPKKKATLTAHKLLESDIIGLWSDLRRLKTVQFMPVNSENKLKDVRGLWF